MTLLLVRSVLRGALVDRAWRWPPPSDSSTRSTRPPAWRAPRRCCRSASLELVLGLVGAGVLVFLGLRTLHSAFRVRLGGETDEEVATPRRAFATAFAATASNPLTIASWAAIFAATTTAGATESGASTVALLVGVGLGSLGWYVVLACAVALARRRIGDRVVRAVDVIAGAGLVAFGGLLGAAIDAASPARRYPERRIVVAAKDAGAKLLLHRATEDTGSGGETRDAV